MGVLITLAALAAYVTGLQKEAVVEPVARWFAGLPTGAELAIIVAIGVVGVAVAVWRVRTRNASLRAAVAAAARHAAPTR